MASPEEHAQVVLSAIIPDRRDLLERAIAYLTPEHFPEPPQANLFKFMERYSDQTGGAVIKRQFLGDLLRDKGAVGKALQYEELWDFCSDTVVSDDEFVWSIEQLRDLEARRATGEALTVAMEIMNSGKQVGNEVVQGHDAARIHVLESIQVIDREITRQEAPEGDIKDEFSSILDDYATQKENRKNGIAGGIRTGVAEIDRRIGGMQNGELVLSVGYSSDGKSSFCVQTSWSAAVEQGKNVVFLTTETLRKQIVRKLVARHSKHPKFGLVDGLNSWDLKSGTLPDALEQQFQEVARDLTKNPAYGHLYVAQVPRQATLATLDQRLHRINRKFQVDFVVMDYLALLGTGLRRNTTREELSQLLKDAKLLAVNFDNSRGVPFMSPWQVNRENRDKAEQLGHYTMQALAETSEATNSSDMILSLLAPMDNTNRHAQIMMQILKNRDGETANGIMVQTDYATSHFASQAIQSLDSFRALSGGSGAMSFNNLDDLLPDEN